MVVQLDLVLERLEQVFCCLAVRTEGEVRGEQGETT